MKIQSLAIIGVIILLPMILILTRYIEHKTEMLSTQVSYDNKLQDSTYDALKAFQLNTSNSDSSDISNSKLRDVKAGCTAFFTSLANNFKMPGADSDTLSNYVPAVVFTMYDGYYIYSPYENTLDMNDFIEKEDNGDFKDYKIESNRKKVGTSTTTKKDFLKNSGYAKYYDEQAMVGLKPYIYYSCRYVHKNLNEVPGRYRYRCNYNIFIG